MVIPLILRDVVASCQFPTNCIVQQTIIQNISFFPSEYKYLCGPSTCKVIALDLFCTVGAGRRPLNTSLALSNLPTLCQPWPCALLRPSPPPVASLWNSSLLLRLCVYCAYLISFFAHLQNTWFQIFTLKNTEKHPKQVKYALFCGQSGKIYT